MGFDYEGRDELLIKTPRINLYIDSADGGALFEFDIKEPGLERNIQDIMTRCREPYLEGSGSTRIGIGGLVGDYACGALTRQ